MSGIESSRKATAIAPLIWVISCIRKKFVKKSTIVNPIHVDVFIMAFIFTKTAINAKTTKKNLTLLMSNICIKAATRKIPGSLNIPIEQISKNAGYIKRLGKPVIFCGNGSESATARRILQQYGLKEVYNGGSWQRVLRLKNSV